MIKSENYITIQGWMRTELNLSGNDLLVYAIIYSYSQGDNTGFNGSLQYLADWCGATKQGILKNLKNLTDRNLIVKTESEKFGETSIYHTTKFNRGLNLVESGIKLSLPGIKLSLPENTKTGKHSLINNISNSIDNKEYNKDYKKKEEIVTEIYNLYVELCPNLPKVRVLTDKRKNLIYKAYTQYGLSDIKECFIKANDSDFLCGKNDRGWKADIEWLLGNKFINVLEGKYSTKKSNPSIKNKPWEKNVESVPMTQEEKDMEEQEANRLEAVGIKARF